MTDHSELLTRLRGTPLYESWGEASTTPEAAADAIESLSREVAALTARAEAAEAKVKRMNCAMSEASDPDFLFGAMDNVNEFGASVSDFSEAASRAIRAYIEYEATREIGGGNDNS